MKILEKYCKYCDKTKPIGEFRKRIDKRVKQKKIYRDSKCISCQSEYLKGRYQEYYRNYYKKHSDKIKKHTKDCRDRNPEKAREYSSNWNKNNKDRHSKSHKKWAEKVRGSISDVYVYGLLKKKYPFITKEYIKKYPQLIKIKRAEILIFRLKKAFKQ